MYDLYAEALNEIYSIDDLLAPPGTPLSIFNDLLIDGPFLDVGCGSSSRLLQYASTGRQLYAIDNDQVCLDSLAKKVSKMEEGNIENWHFENLTFFQDALPDQQFSVVHFGNLLHFFTLSQCRTLPDHLLSVTAPGSMVSLTVHSDKYYANNPEDPKNNDYFKHYFSEDDLNSIFPEEHFDRIYFDSTQRILSPKELRVMKLWGEKIVRQANPKGVSEEYLEYQVQKFVEIQKRQTIAQLCGIFMRK